MNGGTETSSATLNSDESEEKYNDKVRTQPDGESPTPVASDWLEKARNRSANIDWDNVGRRPKSPSPTRTRVRTPSPEKKRYSLTSDEKVDITAKYFDKEKIQRSRSSSRVNDATHFGRSESPQKPAWMQIVVNKRSSGAWDSLTEEDGKPILPEDKPELKENDKGKY